MSAVHPTSGRRGGVGAGASSLNGLRRLDATLDLTRLHAGSLDEAGGLTRALFEAVSQPVALVDVADGAVVYVAANAAYLRVLGRTHEQVVGRTVGDLIEGGPGVEAANRIRDAARADVPVEGLDTVESPAGPLQISWSLVPLGAPDAHRVLVVLDDQTEAYRAEAALVSSEQRFATLASASPTGIFAVNTDGRCTYTNGRMQEIVGREADDLLDHGWLRTVHPDDRQAFEEFQTAVIAGSATPARVRVLRPGGDVRWVEVRTSPLRDALGAITGWVGTASDITEQVSARYLVDQLASILEQTTDLVGVSDPHGHFTWMNAAARAFHSLAPDTDVSLITVRDIYANGSRRKFSREVLPALDRSGHWSGEMTMRSLSGNAEIHVLQSIVVHRAPDGTVESYSSIVRDISERKEFERQLSHQALHDPVTDLPSRPLFMDRLGQALARAARLQTNLAVLSLDLDRFKVVNDSLGHDAGDQLLCAVAHRLLSVLRPTDTIARLGGDEFVILCEDVPGQGVDIAQRIEEAMAAPFVLEEGEIFLTVSMGIATTEDPASASAEGLLRDADAAMYRAKEKGRARFEIVDERLRARTVERTETETALRRAVDQDDIVVHYQPLVSLDTGYIVGVEALARWRHPERGLLMPAEFIPLAEEAGFIVALGERVLRTACSQMADWTERRGDWAPTLWVNLSARQLNHLALFDTLETVLHQTGLDANRLGLEITESVLMEEADSTVAALVELKRLGLGVAIDDFGTGYSSLTYLKRFPVTTLKVDRSFVDGLGRQPEDAAIVSAQVSMSHALGISVIAEGVETQTQLDHLRSLGCDFAQGYYFAPPVPAEALEEMLDLNPRW